MFKQNFGCCSVKFIEYHCFSSVSAASSKPSVGPLTRLKISSFIINIHRGTHISAKYCHIFTNPATI